MTTAGLIPAWAGKTLGNGTLRYAESAHPRVGGENRRLADEVEQA